MSFRFMRKDNTIRTIRNGEFIMAYRADTRQGVSVEYLRSPVTA